MAPSLKTTINKINRTLENNVRIANKVIEENVRNVTKAAQKVPWLHVVIGVVAVGIILYCIWKLLKPKGRKERFGTTTIAGVSVPDLNPEGLPTHLGADIRIMSENDSNRGHFEDVGEYVEAGKTAITKEDVLAQFAKPHGGKATPFAVTIFHNNEGKAVWVRKYATSSTDVKPTTKLRLDTTTPGDQPGSTVIYDPGAILVFTIFDTIKKIIGIKPTAAKPSNINEIQTEGTKFDNINFVGRNLGGSKVVGGTHFIAPVGNMNDCLSAARAKNTDMVYKKSNGECVGKYIRKDDIGKPEPEGITAVGDNDYISISWNSSWSGYNGGKDATTLNAINKGQTGGITTNPASGSASQPANPASGSAAPTPTWEADNVNVLMDGDQGIFLGLMVTNGTKKVKSGVQTVEECKRLVTQLNPPMDMVYGKNNKECWAKYIHAQDGKLAKMTIYDDGNWYSASWNPTMGGYKGNLDKLKADITAAKSGTAIPAGTPGGTVVGTNGCTPLPKSDGACDHYDKYPDTGCVRQCLDTLQSSCSTWKCPEGMNDVGGSDPNRTCYKLEKTIRDQTGVPTYKSRTLNWDDGKSYTYLGDDGKQLTKSCKEVRPEKKDAMKTDGGTIVTRIRGGPAEYKFKRDYWGKWNDDGKSSLSTTQDLNDKAWGGDFSGGLN